MSDDETNITTEFAATEEERPSSNDCMADRELKESTDSGLGCIFAPPPGIEAPGVN